MCVSLREDVHALTIAEEGQQQYRQEKEKMDTKYSFWGVSACLCASPFFPQMQP